MISPHMFTVYASLALPAFVQARTTPEYGPNIGDGLVPFSIPTSNRPFVTAAVNPNATGTAQPKHGFLRGSDLRQTNVTSGLPPYSWRLNVTDVPLGDTSYVPTLKGAVGTINRIFELIVPEDQVARLSRENKTLIFMPIDARAGVEGNYEVPADEDGSCYATLGPSCADELVQRFLGDGRAISHANVPYECRNTTLAEDTSMVGGVAPSFFNQNPDGVAAQNGFVFTSMNSTSNATYTNAYSRMLSYNNTASRSALYHYADAYTPGSENVAYDDAVNRTVAMLVAERFIDEKNRPANGTEFGAITCIKATTIMPGSRIPGPEDSMTGGNGKAGGTSDAGSELVPLASAIGIAMTLALAHTL